ncbi:hypothetical protein ACJMK2_019221 [Sinanodonta woodiana]|uniref:G-protein coupled receptors family 1 profile domain-containing protein n=1 Tax=Sinanodonta woodiana TaxID=1069815 RepID=A0ABD3UIT2_SINWO
MRTSCSEGNTTCKIPIMVLENASGFVLAPSTLEPVGNWDNIDERIKHIALIPLTILILITNFIVLTFIAANKKFHTPTYIFVASLGIADIFVGCVSIVTLTTRANEPTQNLCLLRIGFTVASVMASMLSLTSIAIDRYIAITKALTYNLIMTRSRTFLCIILSWIISLVFGFSPLMGWNNAYYGQYCSFMYVMTTSYIVVLFIIAAVIPMSLMFFIYITLFLNAQVHIKRIQAIENIYAERKNSGLFGISKRNLRSVKTFSAVFGCVVITWLPFMITTVVQIICGDSVCFLKDIIGTHLLVLGFSNSFLNPIIYAIGTKDFRSKVKHIFRSKCSKNGSQVYP